jgi:Helix-turn-helix domain
MSLVLNHSRAKGTDKVVLLGIANHDGDGGAWPSLATLARYANVDERTVRRSIASLVEAGELAVEYNAGGREGQTRGDRRPNLYRVLVQRDGGTPTSSRTAPTGGRPRHSREDAGVNHGRTPTSPELELELEQEPSLFAADAQAPDGGGAETAAARANRLTRAYTDLVPMSRFPAVAGIVRKAIGAGYPDTAITDALVRLAAEGRSVTVDTLRIELEGLPPTRALPVRQSGTSMYVDVATDLASGRALGSAS